MNTGPIGVAWVVDMGCSTRSMWMVFLLMGVAFALLHTVDASDELEIFAGQDKAARVGVPLEFNDAEITKPNPLDPEKSYIFFWDFDNRKDSNLDGGFDNDAESTERFTEWTYWVAGTYIVTLTVFDGEFEDKDNLQVNIRPNEPPVIHANETETAWVGEGHVFSADAIDDNSQPHLLRWHWVFDDGTTSDDPPPVSHTFYIEGTYGVIIRVTDPDNEWTEHVITLTVVENLVISTINIAEGATIKDTFGFMGTISSDVPLDRVEVRFDDEIWLPADGVTNWAYIMDTITLGHGIHLIEVRGLAGSDVYEMISLVFYVDNPPVVDITHPMVGTRYNGTLLASGSALDDGWLDKVEARVDDDPWTAVTGTNEWSFSIDTAPLSHGNHTLFVRGYDGEQYSITTSTQFYVDHIPEVSIDEASDWEDMSPGLMATGAYWDDNDVTGIHARVDGGEWLVTNFGPFVPPPNSWHLPINTIGLVQGDHVLEARAYDGYQYSSIESMVFHIDRQPVVTIDQQPDDRSVKTKLPLSGTLDDDGVVERIEYRIDKGDWVNITVTANWSVTIPIKDLEPGIHEVDIRAYDGSKYSDIETMTFRKEKEEEPGFVAAVSVLSLLVTSILMAKSRRTRYG